MKRKKVAKLMAVVALIGAVGVGGSFALLTAKTTPVRNTFTVGAGLKDTNLYLDETDVNNDEDIVDNIVVEGVTRDKANTYNDIEPDSTLQKDPQVRMVNNIIDGQEIERADSYVFIRVEGCDDFLNEVNEGLDSAEGDELSSFVEWNQNNHWKLIQTENDTAVKDGIYVYSIDGRAATKVTSDVEFEENVFTGISLSKDAQLYDENSAGKKLDQIKIYACAVQATKSEDSYQNALDELPEDFLGNITITATTE